MWVSKEKMDALEERLKRLEEWRYNLANDDHLNFTVFKESPYWSAICYPPHQTISVKDAIGKILYHIGAELKYVEGTPTTVQIQKTKLPA